MANIRVESLGNDRYDVVVDDGRGTSRHEVTAPAAVVADLGGGEAAATRLIEASFEFLLEREPKEAILRRFDLPEIGLHFPDYPGEIRRRLP